MGRRRCRRLTAAPLRNRGLAVTIVDMSSTTGSPSPRAARRVGAALSIALLAGTVGALPAVAHSDEARRVSSHQGNFPASVALPNGFRPEGVTTGPGTTFYAGSVSDGRIWRGDLRTGAGSLLLPAVTGRSLRGMQFDKHTGLLWVVGSEGTTAKVWALNARSGATVATYTVPDGKFLNDLVVTRGAVWVTDSSVDRLTRIALTDDRGPGTAEPTFVPITGAWPTPTGFRANGIRQLRDGKLVLDNSTAGGLYAVDPTTGVAAVIPVTGGPGITGGDGLELRGKTLYVVRGSGMAEVSVLKLKREDGAWRATWLRALSAAGQLDVPSTGTLAAGALYVVNARFGTANPNTATYSVTRLPLRANEKDDDRSHRLSRG